MTTEELLVALNEAQGGRQFSDIGMGEEFWSIREKYQQSLARDIVTPKVDNVIEEVKVVEVIPTEGAPASHDGRVIKSVEDQLAELKANGVIS